MKGRREGGKRGREQQDGGRDGGDKLCRRNDREVVIRKEKVRL